MVPKGPPGSKNSKKSITGSSTAAEDTVVEIAPVQGGGGIA